VFYVTAEGLTFPQDVAAFERVQLTFTLENEINQSVPGASAWISLFLTGNTSINSSTQALDLGNGTYIAELTVFNYPGLAHFKCSITHQDYSFKDVIAVTRVNERLLGNLVVVGLSFPPNVTVGQKVIIRFNLLNNANQTVTGAVAWINLTSSDDFLISTGTLALDLGNGTYIAELTVFNHPSLAYFQCNITHPDYESELKTGVTEVVGIPPFDFIGFLLPPVGLVVFSSVVALIAYYMWKNR